MNLNALEGCFEDFDEFESELQKSSFGPKFVFIEPKYGEFRRHRSGRLHVRKLDASLDDVTRGEKLVKTVYEAIRHSPHWEESLLIVMFDEHRGFYDHVIPPPAVPPSDTITTGYVKKGFRFDQLGVRVTALIISPYIGKGVIDHTVYDHSSALATVERLFGMKNLTEPRQGGERRAAAALAVGTAERTRRRHYRTLQEIRTRCRVTRTKNRKTRS